MKKISGSLQEKNGKYYAVVNHYDADGKRHIKWHSLDVEAKKGNKKKAEEHLRELLAKLNTGNDFLAESMTPAEREKNRVANSLVEDYFPEWLEDYKRNVCNRTYEGYRQKVNGKIVPFFKGKGVTLKYLSGEHLNKFYRELFETGLKGATIQRVHSIVHLGLRCAVKRGILPFNAAEQTERPKAQQFIASYYNEEEIKKLLEVSAKDELHLVILLTAYYGLRRSEVLGLKWSAIDFTGKTICIRHKVVEEDVGPVGYDVMKTKSSYRTLPLLPFIEDELLKEKAKQKEMKQVMRRNYNTDYEEYVNVDALGRLYKPNFVTNHFDVVLNRNGMRHIRFHELRHSCASLLLAKHIPMKMIQDWLGHSDIQTTANIYSHLDAQSKQESAVAIGEALAMGK